MRALLLGLVPVMGLVLALVMWVDPAHRGLRKVTGPERTLREGEVYVAPNNLDTLALKSSLLRVQPAPDTVVLGSSRAMVIDSDMIPGRPRLLNLGAPSARFEDLAAMWQLVKEKPARPKLAIVVLDPWFFDTKVDETTYRVTCAPLRRFLSESNDEGSLRGWFGQARCLTTTELQEASNWVSWLSVQYSLETVAMRLKTKRWPFDPPSIVPLADLAGRSAIRWDGAQPGAASTVDEDVRAAARRWASDFAQSRWELSSKQQTLFRSLLSDLARRGTSVLAVVPPVHPEAWRTLTASEQGVDILERFARAVTATSGGISNVFKCSRLDPTPLSCGTSDFTDGYHPKYACYARTLASCFDARGEQTPLLRSSEIGSGGQ